MIRYGLFDMNNLVMRSRHSTAAKSSTSIEDFVGTILFQVYGAFRKATERFQINHSVACFDSPSWRKLEYPEYKANRTADPDAAPVELERDEATIKILREIETYLDEHTNVTVLRGIGIEADDFIARWTQLHHDPELFQHVVFSGDGDFKQLVSENVALFNPLENSIATLSGVFYQDGRIARGEPTANLFGSEWKIKRDKAGEPIQFDPSWELFLKCIRGDVSDNIRSAFPKVRETRLRKAFEDRGGLEWNNLINEVVQTKSGESWYVRDRYERNRSLIDLSCQPKLVVDAMDEVIDSAMGKPAKKFIPVYFAKMCQKYGMIRLQQQADTIIPVLINPYRSA